MHHGKSHMEKSRNKILVWGCAESRFNQRQVWESDLNYENSLLWWLQRFFLLSGWQINSSMVSLLQVYLWKSAGLEGGSIRCIYSRLFSVFCFCLLKECGSLHWNLFHTRLCTLGVWRQQWELCTCCLLWHRDTLTHGIPSGVWDCRLGRFR